MTTTPQLRVLFFDVFGTCVAQRAPVGDELWKAAQEALKSDVSSISGDIRVKTADMSYEEWLELAGEWNKEENEFVHSCIAKHGAVDWRAVDKHRIEALPKLLARRGLVTQQGDSCVGEGSLWNTSQLEHLGRVWHRLTPWPDTCRGLTLLNTRFHTVALSNTYSELLQSLVAYSSIPFAHVYSADMFNSFKPNPKVYLGAAEKMGVKPEECGLVAAHLNDLKGAKACGFRAIYVERPLEEKTPELKGESIPDLTIGEGDGGFVVLAKQLGIDVDQ